MSSAQPIESFRRPVSASLVAVSSHRNDNRNMFLEDVPSRALRRYDIHEILLTPDSSLGPGDFVPRISVVGFAEILTGGMTRIGDSISVNGVGVGRIIGYDFCHMPNHLNIVAGADASAYRDTQVPTGREFGLLVGSTVCFSPWGDS